MGLSPASQESPPTSNSRFLRRNSPPTSWLFLALEDTEKDISASSRTQFFTSNAMAPHSPFWPSRHLNIRSIHLLPHPRKKQLKPPTLLTARHGIPTSLYAPSHATNSQRLSMMYIMLRLMIPPRVSMQFFPPGSCHPHPNHLRINLPAQH